MLESLYLNGKNAAAQVSHRPAAAHCLHPSPQPLAIPPGPHRHLTPATRLAIGCAILTLSVALPSTSFAQGNFDPLALLRADSSAPLHSFSQTLFIPLSQTQSGFSSPNLSFEFGFETDEVFAPDQIFDAFSITLQTVDDLVTLILLTSDASGAVFLPATPGEIQALNANLVPSAIIPPSLDPKLSAQWAFSVQAFLPEQFLGKDTTLFLDLFDNGNSVRSQAWFGQLTVVPEPSSFTLLGLGMAGLCTLFRRSRKQ